MGRSEALLLNVAANLVALLHIGYFLFVLGGVVAIIAGHIRQWSWIRRPWLRLLHLGAVFLVLFEEVTGIPCVLNLLQWALRSGATGQQQATEGVGGVLDFLLYGTISPLALDIIYWSMGALVLLLLWKVPIQSRGSDAERHSY